MSFRPSSPRTVSAANHASSDSSAICSLPSTSPRGRLPTRLGLSPTGREARKGLLRETFFDQFKDDYPTSAATAALSRTDADAETPEEMQKNDPLGTQIWKLYHKTKGQLPNSERLENLSWRMMSMNLKRKELERQGCVRQAGGGSGITTDSDAGWLPDRSLLPKMPQAVSRSCVSPPNRSGKWLSSRRPARTT